MILAALVASSCGDLTAGRSPTGRGPASRDPIVLVTVAGLRADAVGASAFEASRTPRLDDFAAAADWAGTVVAASSDPLASLASLMFGVRPWQHQRLWAERPARRDLPTLAQVARNAGYTTRAHIPRSLHGLLGAGFDQIEDDVSGRDAAEAVADLADGEFVWLHLREAEIARGRWRYGSGEPRFARRQLLAYADPRRTLPEKMRRDLWSVYRHGVERLDHLLGEILDSLRRGPAWERTSVIVTASHGCELGEHGGILAGENLGRESIEVPLVFRGPTELGWKTGRGSGRPAQIRLFTTIAELAGAAVAPVHPPGLSATTADTPVLSELYRGNGVNRFSLLDGDLQLHWTTRFARAEPEYYLALQVLAGGRSRRLEEPAKRIFRRLDNAFEATPPLSGPPGSDPALALERWIAGGAERLDDPAAARALAPRLERRWRRFVDRERTPGQERAVGIEPVSDRVF